MKIGDLDVLPVDVSVWAGGVLRAGSGIVHQLDTREHAHSMWRLDGRLSTFDDYIVEVESLGSAGPEEWLTLRLSLYDRSRTPLGVVGTPALLWMRPWAVPMVCHLPQIHPGIPVHTVTLHVRAKLTLEPPAQASG